MAASRGIRSPEDTARLPHQQRLRYRRRHHRRPDPRRHRGLRRLSRPPQLPGIDAQYLKGKLADKDWNKLFTDISPEDLSGKGKAFPIAPYFNDILESYEKKVAN